jgi:putative transposase
MVNPLTMKRTYRYRLYPTPEQEQKMGGWLERLRWLYNTALSERRNNWKYNKKRIYCNTQITNLPPLKVRKPEYGDIYSQVLQDAIKRLDKAYANFFRRDAENKEVGYRKHKKLGYPRYKTNPSRYRSFGYPQATGFRVLESGRKVRLAGIGNVKLKYHRELEGVPKTAMVVRYPSGKWYVCISCDVGVAPPVDYSGEITGFDLGLTSYAVSSDGEVTKPLRATRQAAKKLSREQRKLSRRHKGSRRREKQRVKVARVHESVKNRRRDFLHKTSRKLVDENKGLAFERLQISNMLRNPRLAKAIADAGWYTFREMAAYKAESAGKPFVLVDPRGTTQKCSRCHTHVPKTLADREHHCPVCGLRLTRDHNSGRNIQSRSGTVLTHARGEAAATGAPAMVSGKQSH